jgi:hypothetical protein
VNSLILGDALFAPGLFLWNGPVDRLELDRWIALRGWAVPADLLEFWTTTGGGEILESESFLRPLVSPDGEDEMARVTSWCEQRGMPGGLVVFHEGLGFTSIRLRDQAYISFDSSVRVLGEYKSLDHWYAEVLRAEYAERYGLPPSPKNQD